MAKKIKYPMHVQAGDAEYVKVISHKEMITVKFGKYRSIGHATDIHETVTKDLVLGSDIITKEEFDVKLNTVKKEIEEEIG